MNPWKVIFLCLCALVVAACSTTRSLQDGEYLLRKNRVEVDDPSFDASALTSYISQKPNTYLLGTSPLLSVYNWGGKGETGLGRFFRKLGTPPVVYDPSRVDHSIGNIENHLRYIGYYGSQVESRVKVKGRKVYVTYYVALGKRYTISTIDYDIPEYGSFPADFMADLPNSTIAPGQYLSEESLEQEAQRQAQYFRNSGYYGFTKSYYAFEADTLALDGTARLTMSIRDYGLGDAPSAAQEHKKFYLGKVTISHPKNLKIRPSVLENLNTLRPGTLYDEREVNTTYSRFASVGILNGVNVNMTPVSEDRVDCDITLRSSGLQGFKTNLEASVNSTGLFGISPQLSYYHKNLFHGGELLNLGFKGNFQFKPKDPAYSNEVSVSASIRFPQMVGLPNRLFKGPNLPSTEISAAFSYQDRPEYRRTLISSAFAYTGRWGKGFFYQLTPIRANIARLFTVDPNFLVVMLSTNPFLLMAYMDHFDLGTSGSLYYTTDTATVPMSAYHYVRFTLDLSGNVVSLFNPLMPVNEEGQRTIWQTPYAQYVRGELNLGKVFRFGRDERQALALHLAAGAGLAYGNSSSLPIERYFYCGGSMSMRGWQARTLGPGNMQPYDIFAIPTQIGDMKLEANLEYRFPLVWKLEGALFADAGNIWDLNSSTEDYQGLFRWKSLPESIGLDWGLGLRVNLNFILVRLDAGVRLHDPARDEGDRWVAPKEWFRGGNTAIHFGVGYPF